MPHVHVPVIGWTGVVSMSCASSLLDVRSFPATEDTEKNLRPRRSSSLVAQYGLAAGTKTTSRHLPPVDNLGVETLCLCGPREMFQKMFAKKTKYYGIAMQGPLSGPPILMAGSFSTLNVKGLGVTVRV